jgi:ABC-type dipeptide/oligopeptide/nickel transport system permease subunit
VSATLASLGSETVRGVFPGRSRRRWALGIGFLAARPLAIIGIVVLLAWIGVMIFAPAIAPVPPLKQDFSVRFAPPSRQHPFGTDKLGRDQLARVAYGARISIPVGVMVIALAGVAGVGIGAVAGFRGGLVDETVMRVTDVFLAFPPIILALAIAAALGPDLRNAMLALVVVWWPTYARMMRGVTLSVRQQEYVQAAVAAGAGTPSLLLRTILPNAFMPLLVLATVDIGGGITAAAALSYLGLGVRPPTPEWGAMVADGALSLNQWWLATFPGLAIFSVVMAFNLAGDAVQDALDPRLRGGR